MAKRCPGAENGGPDDFGPVGEFRAIAAFLQGGFRLGVLTLGFYHRPEVQMGILWLGEDRRPHPEEDEEERKGQDYRPPEFLIGNGENR